MTNPNKKTQLDNVTTLKEGWQFFLEVFRDVIPKGQEYKFESAWYAGAATYDAILFNKIRKAADKVDEGDTVHMNITDHIFSLHEEVCVFAKKRVETSEAAINMGNQRN